MKIYEVAYYEHNYHGTKNVRYGIFSTKEKARDAYENCRIAIKAKEDSEENKSQYTPIFYDMLDIVEIELDKEGKDFKK